MSSLSLPAAAFLGLGGNVGDRLEHLSSGLRSLAATPGVVLTGVSSLWESAYVGPGDQAPYLNACVRVKTTLAPPALLGLCKSLEQERGRTPDTHLQPRPLDLDVLLYGDLRQRDAEPHLPHPRLAQRAFVLTPLAEIAGGTILPDSGETVATACAKIRRDDGPWLRPRPDLAWPPPGLDTEEDGRGALALHRR